MRAIFAVAGTTVNEAIRRRVLLIILFIGALLLSIIPALSVLSARSEFTVTVSAMFAVLRGTAALIAVILTIYMIPNEIERRTIYTILSKPCQRWQFLVGKYLGAVAALGLMILLMTVLMVGVFWVFQRPSPEKVMEVLRQPPIYFLEMCLLAAVGMFFSTFVAPLVNFFLTIGLWLIGTVLNPLYDTIANNSGANVFVSSMAKIITTVLPNFATFDVKNPIINPGQIIQSEQVYLLNTVMYGIVYSALLIVAAIFIFDRREV
jgi:ABC-type transport system involved in multi-copper enzyme maturation permease subunit